MGRTQQRGGWRTTFPGVCPRCLALLRAANCIAACLPAGQKLGTRGMYYTGINSTPSNQHNVRTVSGGVVILQYTRESDNVTGETRCILALEACITRADRAPTVWE